MGITAAVILLIGLGLLLARRPVTVRSWLALMLVAGLLLFSVLSFAVNDSATRGTLLGAVGAVVGTVVAFYFTSKTTEQTNQLLAATVGTESVPDLSNLSEAQAKEKLGATSLRLVTAPTSQPPSGTATVTGQEPIAGTVVPKGASIFVTYG
ncbi:PASTA domain-containing protein [Kitasatospora sp. NPDC048365]|uniref:PASTA domain-containing protein n=1 Tax=Kitasatospora sp. NPDC048365 TaxID=3364050 RepID=UPI003716DEF2